MKIKQGSPEWHKLRLGKFTASTVYKLMGSKGLGEIGNTHILEKVTEELTGMWDNISSPAIEWGKMYEQEAALYFEISMNNFGKNFKLIEDGFKQWDLNKNVGVSPDRLIKNNKIGVEIKCPYKEINHTKHLLLETQNDLKNLKSGSTKGIYYWQIQLQLLVYNYDYWYFVSYHPHFVGYNRMLVLPIKKDPKDQELLKERLFEAIGIKENLIKKLK